MKYHRLSAAAYESEQLATVAAEAIGFSFVKHVHDIETGADAMIFVSSNEVVVAFRGTQKNYADIVTDLKFRKAGLLLIEPYQMIEVHRGFRDQWLSIRDTLHEAISLVSGPDHTLSVTGHSLGGALAIQAALEWRWIKSLVTFGTPRIATQEIVSLMSERNHAHRRYVFGADIVPILPLLTMGYRHDCRPIYLTRSGKAIQQCPLWRELLGRARALFSCDWIECWSWCRVPRRIFTDHKIIVEYREALQRAGE